VRRIYSAVYEGCYYSILIILNVINSYPWLVWGARTPAYPFSSSVYCLSVYCLSVYCLSVYCLSVYCLSVYCLSVYTANFSIFSQSCTGIPIPICKKICGCVLSGLHFKRTMSRDFRHLFFLSSNNSIWAPDSRVNTFSNMPSN
jgi:hypothetical protein